MHLNRKAFDFLLDLQEQSHSSQSPLGWALFGLQVKGPNIRGSPLARLVDRTLIHIPVFLLVDRNGSYEDDWHGWPELFQPRINNQARLGGRKIKESEELRIARGLRSQSSRDRNLF